MSWIGINDTTNNAVVEQGVENITNLSELTFKDVHYLVSNVMKYHAPLVEPGQYGFRSVQSRSLRLHGTGLILGGGPDKPGRQTSLTQSSWLLR
jgi:hypothetical protein